MEIAYINSPLGAIEIKGNEEGIASVRFLGSEEKVIDLNST
jgi:hypothetical protein